MAKPQFYILLSIGLLVAASGPGAANSSDGAPVWRTARADTARAPRPYGLWNGQRQDRGDPRFRGRAGLEPVSPRSTSLALARSQPGRTRAAGEPVADPNLWGANGNVVGIARSGNTLYIAGAFRSVGENSGGFVPIDARTGEALRPFPKVAGFVYAIVPDGLGGWYLGGEFTAVAGKLRSCLAQIRADGSVSDWNPRVTGSPGYIDPPQVNAIAVRGDRVFVGGGFREIGGLPRLHLGCVDARTGAVLDWSADTHVGAWVYALAVHDSTVFVGGGFSSIGGQPRSSLAAVNAASGEVLPWRADVFGGAYALLVRGDTLYVGGDFFGIAGVERHMLAALDLRTAQLLPFEARASGIQRSSWPDPLVAALALMGDTLYVGGNFTQIGGQARSSLAALNATTGDALAWTPPSFGPQYDGFPPPLLLTLAMSAGTVYVGGGFETVGGESRPFVAALNRETGAPTAWNPKPDLSVYALAVKGDTVNVGGDFSLVGEWWHRAGLAAIDLTTGAVKPWNPNPDGGVCTAVAVGGDRVFVSGDFSNIGGDPQPRSYFAALDTVNGEVTDWNPGANSLADMFLLAGDTLYAGGEFTQIGGKPRNYVAAIDVQTGQVTAWNPNASWPVLTMARSGDVMYVGGLFTRIGGQVRQGIAAVDAITGALTPWDPGPDNSMVEALLVSGNTVYVGGAFNQIGGQARKSLAALDAVSGTAAAWDPHPTEWNVVDPRVRALALVGSVLYIGGSFASIGGQPRICLAAVDTSTGLATDWDPGTDGLVWSLAACGNTIYAGGGFTRAGGLPCAGLAAFSLAAPAPPRPPVSRVAISLITPNPVRSGASIRLALPSSGPVGLDVFDLQGRRVATILHNEMRTAGIQDVSIRTDGWPRGLYFCRLEASGATATRKMMVIR